MRYFFWVICFVVASFSYAFPAVRIKDITALEGLRDNQLIGYGLVVGLQGTGDSLRNAPFTDQALQSMLDRLGISLKSGAARARNIAAVIVTADMPPFVRSGWKIDVTVSSMGDATSLMGGTLLMTSLTGMDGQTYAVAQGSVVTSGFAAAGQSENLTQGVPTAGRIPSGATIEKELPFSLKSKDILTLQLRNPDFATALHIIDAINKYARSRFGMPIAYERDHQTLVLKPPRTMGIPRLMAEIGDLVVEADAPARVVVDARTGTVVIGQDVKISTLAVTQGDLTVRVTEMPMVSQPAPLSQGQTTVTAQTTISATQEGGHLALIGGTNLRNLVSGLNQIGLKPAGIISILQAIKAAGALQAELVIQ